MSTHCSALAAIADRDPVLAAIALGSNLGDRRATLESAIEALGAIPDSSVRRVSRVVETPPLPLPAGDDADPGGPYLNAVAVVETSLPPLDLLQALFRIEETNGRVREPGGRWHPRTLDLDIILYGDRIIDEPNLVVPHPRLAERAFVLEPLAELLPAFVVPTCGRTVRSLADALRGRCDDC